MKIVRFRLGYTIKRRDFIKAQDLDGFNGRVYYNKIRKHLFITSTDKVNRLKNRNFIARWWNNYEKLKNLTENYTYLDIDVVFWESPQECLVRALTNVSMNHMKEGGLI